MVEEWRDIEGFEGIYQVSSFGRVRGLDRYVRQKNKYGSMMDVFIRGVIIKPFNVNSGYSYVFLKRRKEHLSFGIHRLVAKAFIPNPNGLRYVNHKDENKKNNHVDNLEWCTCQYNNTYGSVKERQVANLPTKKAVIQMAISGEVIAEYPTIKAAARAVGASSICISRCCRGKIQTSQGFRWAYKQ